MGATPTDCGNDRDAEEAAPQDIPAIFLPKCRKALRIYSETPNQSARAFGERFWHKTRFGTAGILCVFQAFQAAGLGQKIRRKPQTVCLVFPQKMKGGNQMKTRKKWRPGGLQRQSAAYHRKAVHERRRVVRLRVWTKGEKNGVVAEV